MFSTKQKTSFLADLPFLCEQMQILLRSGLSLTQVFENLEGDFQGSVKKILQTINQSLKSGEDLSSVLQELIPSWRQTYEVVWLQNLILYLRFGGNIIQSLGALGQIAQENIQDQRMKQIALAQGKATLMILSLLWFFSLFFLRIFSPEAFLLLLKTFSGKILFCLSLFFFVCGLFSIKKVMKGEPFFWQRKKRRQEQFQKELPLLLHLVSFVVFSGSDINFAFQSVFKMQGLLFQQSVSSSVKRNSFLIFDLQEEKEFKTLESLQLILKRLLKSQEMGGGAGDFLHYQIRQLQMQYRQNEEEKARLATIKMSLPLALFIFPSLLLLYIGPSLLLFLQG